LQDIESPDEQAVAPGHTRSNSTATRKASCLGSIADGASHPSPNLSKVAFLSCSCPNFSAIYSNSDLKQAASAAGSPGIAAAVSRVPGQQPELSQALLRASQTVDSAAAAFGAAPAAGARLAEPAALQPDAGPLQAAQLLGWAVAAAPALCADDVAAQQLAVCAFAVRTARDCCCAPTSVAHAASQACCEWQPAEPEMAKASAGDELRPVSNCLLTHQTTLI